MPNLFNTIFTPSQKGYEQRMRDLQRWAKAWRGISAVFVVVLIAALVYAVYTFWLGNGTFNLLLFKPVGKQVTPLFNIKDLLIGVSGLIAIFATAWRYKLHEVENLLKSKDAEIKEKDSNINDAKRLDDQFAKAVELLKEDNDLTVRRGGVYILKNLALHSPQHLQQCVDLLCSLNNWMSGALQVDPNFFISYDAQNRRWSDRHLEDEPWQNALSNPATDQEKELRSEEKRLRNKQLISRDVLKVVTEIIQAYSEKPGLLAKKLSFKRYNLCGLYLTDINDASFIEWGYSNLHGAFLRAVNFDKVSLFGANLSYALLSDCSARESDFGHTNLEGATLWNLDLRCASMRSVKAMAIDINSSLLMGTDVNNSNFRLALFRDTQMQGADCRSLKINTDYYLNDKTNFDGSIFHNSCLSGSIFLGLQDQSIIYESEQDEWMEKKFTGDFLWSKESQETIGSTIERYQAAKANRNGIIKADENFKVTKDFWSIGELWAKEIENKPALKYHIERRFDKVNDNFKKDVLGAVRSGYERVTPVTTI